MSDNLKGVGVGKLLTVKEAADEYFQGKVSEREIYALFARGELRGFRVGTGKGKIILYEASLDEYRRGRENAAQIATVIPPTRPATEPKRHDTAPPIRLKRLPTD